MHFSKTTRLLSSVALGLFLFSGAALAQASTLSVPQVQAITSLLQAFNVDPATIANVQMILGNQTTATQATSSSSGQGTVSQGQGGGSCNVLDNNLQAGATDQSTSGDVSQLQAFLGKDKSIYPEDMVTGHFGDLTLQAVQRWQAAHGIASSGDSGFGVIGPKTRGEINKEMELECEQGDSQHTSSGGEGENSNNNTASSTSSHDSGSDN